MSLVIEREGGQPVHFPKSNVFRFDEEVAQIFENMAQRSIPMYSEFHRLHASMLGPRLRNAPAVLYDIGASTGKWFRTLRKVLGVARLDEVPDLQCYAFDNSTPMLEKLRAEFPEVTTYNLDLAATQGYRPPAPASFVTMFYVLQFLPFESKFSALQWVYDNMQSGGVLLVGQKEDMGEDMDLFQEEYIRFRLANGYTQEEIDAKTAALKNSMWCSSPKELRGLLAAAGFTKIVETTRWLQFSTLMATR